MKKSLLTIMMSAVFAFGLAGCNGNPTSSQVTPSTGGETPTPSNTASTDKPTPATSSTSTGGGAINPVENVYSKLMYDISVEAYDVSVALEIGDVKVTKIACGRYNSTSASDFNYADGVLTVSGTFMKQITAGEKEIVLTLDSGSTSRVPVLVCTKIITTAQEFQDINENLSGTYALGNDIDLSSITNFEPLGYFFDNEADIRNDYFHGILEGNGYTVSNAKVYWSENYASDIGGIQTYDSSTVYYNGSLFKSEAHQSGNNIGLFQIIGSSGVVRNTTFSNIAIRGRSILGVIAGNNSGTIENCIVEASCKVQGGTHFYDNDCNIGGVVGINAASGRIINTISKTTNIVFPNVFIDYGEEYIGKIGNGWDHVATPGNNDPSWKYANVNRDVRDYNQGDAPATSSKELDSNGTNSNGIYSFCGKSWGTIENSIGASFTLYPYEGAARTINFGQTHVGTIKPTSGPDNMGTFTNCVVKTVEEMKDSTLYTSYDPSIWVIADNTVPSIKKPIYGIIED